MGPTIRDYGLLREAARLAGDGELGNSDAIRLLQLPHCARDVLDVLRKFDRQISREARGKLTLEAFVPLPEGVKNQRFEPIFDRYPISGETYTTADGTVVLNEVQYYNGRMVQFHGDCTNVAAVEKALAGSGYRPMTLKHADGSETAIVQFWAHNLTDTSLRPYGAMFIVVAAVPEDAAADQACIRADDNGASCVLASFTGTFDRSRALYQNRPRLFFVRLLDTTKVAIDVGRERMGTDKRPGSIDVVLDGRQIALTVRDKSGRLVAKGHIVLAADSAAYLPALTKAAATAGIPFDPLPAGTEYVFPAVARIGQGPVVHWDWRTDVVPKFQPAGPNLIAFDPGSEEGEMLIRWGFRPRVLGYIPNVRGVITGIPERPAAPQARRPGGAEVPSPLRCAKVEAPAAASTARSSGAKPGKVVIIGGGIAGLSAAHELIERGFAVDVYEGRASPGGKARSMPFPGTGKPGPAGMRKDLPGEHGFRFFPRFYRHVTDTMARIPYRGTRTVADNLVDTTRLELARFGKPPVLLPSRSPRSAADFRLILEDLRLLYAGDLGLTHQEIAFFASRVWQILTSCQERRATEYEKMDWWSFIDADRYSDGYQKLLGHGITRSLVAAKAHQASTKTIGNILVQLLIDIAKPGVSTDRVLNGPTSDVWISPWVDYLTSMGVQFHFGAKATAITCSEGRIRNVVCRSERGPVTARGDWYVFAVPVERMGELLTPELTAADPALANLRTLEKSTDWMNGIQLYLTEDLELPHGHTIYVDSPWALTSINQSEFWNEFDLSQYGDGTIRDIVSIDISEWERKGLNGKTAKECTPEEVRAEVWEQMKRSWNVGGKVVLRDEQLHSWFLDPSISLSAVDPDINEEPLLINIVDTWALRPEAATRIPNMFLAADYVRTHTDLATMEAANEAARRAVNGILEAARVDAPPCEVWPLHEPEIFAPWRALDEVRFRQGLPWDDSLVVAGLSAVDLAAAAGIDGGTVPNLMDLDDAAGSVATATTLPERSGPGLPERDAARFDDRLAGAKGRSSDAFDNRRAAGAGDIARSRSGRVRISPQ